MHQPAQQNQNPPSNESCRSTTQNTGKMIQDLWAVMTALFGSKWTSQFGEKTDITGQWRQTLDDVSRAQVAAGIDAVRKSGRAWPPTAPEFREICLNAGKPPVKSADEVYVEVQNYVGNSCRDPWSLSPEAYHTVSRNLDMWNYRNMNFNDAHKAFHSAYRATLAQIKAGEELATPPAKETLLEDQTAQPGKPMTPEEKAASEATSRETISSLMAMFDGGEQ